VSPPDANSEKSIINKNKAFPIKFISRKHHRVNQYELSAGNYFEKNVNTTENNTYNFKKR